MPKTVVAVYEDMEDAQAAVQELLDAGFSREDISLMSRRRGAEGEYVEEEEGNKAGEGAAVGAGVGALVGGIGGLLVGLGALVIPGLGPLVLAGELAATLIGAGVGATVGAVVGALVGLGIPEEEAEYYAEAVRRGGVLVAVRTSDALTPRAVEIMEDEDPWDIRERAAAWRAEGWEPSRGTAETFERRRAEPAMEREDEAEFEEIEEELKVGKRETEAGGVRVRTRVYEEPVEEEVRLREARVDVERERVDRPASERDLEAMEEGTVEFRETREEPVVEKEARVVEEVRVRRDVETRTETIRDTVRRQDIEVEDIEEGRGIIDRNFGTYEPRFREHYTATYPAGRYEWDDYRRAYLYGYELGTHGRYRTMDWNVVQPEARRRWEERNPGTWNNFQAAVREGWRMAHDETTGSHRAA